MATTSAPKGRSASPALHDGCVEGIAIRTSGLSRTFGRLTAVDDLDLTVRAGELLALLGPNGAGKTTTIRMLCCLLRPTAGTATVAGHDILTEPLAVKRAIDVSPQETAVAEHLDARENLRLMAGLHGLTPDEARTRSAELLELLGLADRAAERVKTFSGGMKRRLSIAMALVSDPQVLFLDEPTLGLDPQSRHAIWERITALKGDTTIVLTTHYLEEADALADRVAIIDDGRIVAHGTPTELKDRSGAGVTIVEASNLSNDAIDVLRRRYTTVGRTTAGVEIEDDDVRLYDLVDCLRPMGVVIDAAYVQHVTLDDAYLQLTGKELRP